MDELFGTHNPQVDPQNWIGGKGYLGLGMLISITKLPHRKLLDWEKEFNAAALD